MSNILIPDVILDLYEHDIQELELHIECSICLKTFFSDVPIALLKCGHCFHEECVGSWFFKVF